MALGQRRHPSLTSESAAEGSDAQRTGENAFLTLPAATRKKRENRSERKPRQSRANYDENVWLVMNFRDHPVGRSWRSNDSSGAVVAWQWRNSNASTESEATKSIDFPNDEIGEEKTRDLAEKTKANERAAERNLLNYRNNELSNYRNNKLSKQRNIEISRQWIIELSK